MLKAISDALFLSPDERQMKAYAKRVDAINAMEPALQALDDDDLKGTGISLRVRARAGEKLDALLPEAFALVREAARRAIGQRHYDVQLIGGMVLHDGMLAEMRTGEGKTLVATLAAFLNALPGKGAHVVTANDYLSRRDHDTMGPILRMLGLTVGHVGPETSPEERRAAYACDVTYATNTQIGFDFLRDGLVLDRKEMVQRGFAYAIVDEVDSILIDEARTPLIISGAAEDNSQLYQAIDRFVVRVPGNEVEFDEKERSVVLTDAGLTRVETMMTNAGLLKDESHLHDTQNATLLHHTTAALRAHHMFKRDQHYVVQDGEVLLVDEFTGRTLPGRRMSEGIHQAIEAKERVLINPESDTIASITLQNLFRLYEKLSGMTGTAITEAKEFADIYGLGVLRVPTNRPVVRKDLADMIYRTHQEKIDAVLKAVAEAHGRLQPILIGTASIEGSEEIATALEKAGYARLDFDDAHALDPVYEAAENGAQAKRFAVLNARHHGQEAYAISQAGVPGAIMVATNMAGRGTDIQLGGDPTMRIARETATLDPEATERRRDEILEQTRRFGTKAREAGGLYVIGTERHESRRIDNQLRGRSGRQGDPGRSQFYLAFTDPVIRRFGKLDFLADQLELKAGEAISHRMVTAAVDKAQAKQEAHNFDIRKNVLKFDDVVNDQRKAVAGERTRILDAEHVSDLVTEMREGWIDDLVSNCLPKGTYPEQWDAERLESEIKRVLWLDAPVKAWFEEEGIDPAEIGKRLRDMADEAFALRSKEYGDRFAKDVEQRYSLMILDMAWREMLAELDHLKQAVGWRAIGQRDPIAEFQVEASGGFERMIDRWHELVTLETMRPRMTATAAAA